MNYILATLLSYLLLYKYFAIFAIVFLSGLLLPLPSNTLLLAAGAFASQGYMDAVLVFIVALIANVLGDSASYALTRIWGTKIITEERLHRFSAVAKVEQFVRSHTGLTILVTRFLGTPGVIVNFLSGLIKVPYWRFVMYDAIGNVFDIACFLLIGYYLGVYTENYSDIAALVGWIVLVVILIFLVFRLFFKQKRAV